MLVSGVLVLLVLFSNPVCCFSVLCSCRLSFLFLSFQCFAIEIDSRILLPGSILSLCGDSKSVLIGLHDGFGSLIDSLVFSPPFSIDVSHIAAQIEPVSNNLALSLPSAQGFQRFFF